jgi:hypothetical protein
MPHFIQMLTVDDKENHSLVQRAYNDFNRDAAVQARRPKLSTSYGMSSPGAEVQRRISFHRTSRETLAANGDRWGSSMQEIVW